VSGVREPNRGFDGMQMSDHVGVENVFDTTGRPPAGWMHAIFADGPFEPDVGRCVPGPPPADPLVISRQRNRLVGGQEPAVGGSEFATGA
jgi:hypothetical protein